MGFFVQCTIYSTVNDNPMNLIWDLINAAPGILLQSTTIDSHPKWGSSRISYELHNPLAAYDYCLLSVLFHTQSTHKMYLCRHKAAEYIESN